MNNVDNIIDGKAFAARLRADIGRKVGELKSRHGIIPGLAVVLVGEDPASQVYVRNKGKQTEAAGMKSFEHRLGTETTEAELLTLVENLNQDPSVNGILVQLPLPEQIREASVINSVRPDKDVDGFHISNAGLLATGGQGLVPCTPLGCLIELKHRFASLPGPRALVLCRPQIFRQPIAPSLRC